MKTQTFFGELVGDQAHDEQDWIRWNAGVHPCGCEGERQVMIPSNGSRACGVWHRVFFRDLRCPIHGLRHGPIDTIGGRYVHPSFRRRSA